MVTRKPPKGLAGAPYLEANGIDVMALTEKTPDLRRRRARGGKGFPANVNVAAALSLAGIGPDATRVEIWAEPGSTRNTHTIEIEAEAARFTMTIEGVPSAESTHREAHAAERDRLPRGPRLAPEDRFLSLTPRARRADARRRRRQPRARRA